MSLVTTPSRASPLKAPHSAAMRLLLPEPTGPPTPIRSARSTGKESFPLFEVDGGGELERDRRGRRQRPVIGGDARRGRARGGRELGEPARGLGRVERQQLQRGGGDGGRVVVERQQRDLLVGEARGAGDDAERDRARRPARRPPVGRDRAAGPHGRGRAQQLGAEPPGGLAQHGARRARRRASRGRLWTGGGNSGGALIRSAGSARARGPTSPADRGNARGTPPARAPGRSSARSPPAARRTPSS